MIVVLRRDGGEGDAERVLGELRRLGLSGSVLRAGGAPVVHVTSSDTRAARALAGMEEVESLLPTSGPRVRREGRRFYPYHFVRWSAAGILLVGLLVLLSGQLPPGRGADIDPFAGALAIDFPWYLRPVEALVGAFPPEQAWLGWLAVWALVLIVFLLPVLDRTRGRSFLARLPIVAAGVIVLALLALLVTGGLS